MCHFKHSISAWARACSLGVTGPPRIHAEAQCSGGRADVGRRARWSGIVVRWVQASFGGVPLTWTSLSMDVSTSVRGRTTRRARPRQRPGASALWRTGGRAQEREAGEGGNAYGEEGVAAMTRPVFEDVDDVAAERRRWRPCLGRCGFGKISLAAYARTIFDRPDVLGRCRQTSSCRATIAGARRHCRSQTRGKSSSARVRAVWLGRSWEDLAGSVRARDF